MPQAMSDENANATRPALEVSVVIPVCNEEDNVEPLAREIAAALSKTNRTKQQRRRTIA